jgi:hypothetical protein
MSVKKHSKDCEVCVSHDYATILPLLGHKDLIDLFMNFKRLISKVEYDSVKNGDRDVVNYWIYTKTADKQIESLSKEKLIFLPCAKTIAGNTFIHNLVSEENLEKPNSAIYGVVAQDLDTAEEFVEAFKSRDDKKIGKLHGYPDCCVDTYSKRLSYDPIYEMTKETSDFDTINDRIMEYNPLLLQHLRYWGPKIVPWFPCNLKCKKSESLAEEWLDRLLKVDRTLTTNILDILKMPTEWSLLNCQVIVKHPLFIGYATSYWYDGLRKVIFDPQKEDYVYTGKFGLRNMFDPKWTNSVPTAPVP